MQKVFDTQPWRQEQNKLTPDELVVSGYIRTIEVLLVNNLMNRIPDEIFILCYQFYKYFTKFPIAYCAMLDSSL